MGLTITHDAEGRRFITILDGLTSYLSYAVIDPQTLDYRSTFVPEALRGRGIASDLAVHALQYAKDHRLKVVPSCPFVARVMERQPAFHDLAP